MTIEWGGSGALWSCVRYSDTFDLHAALREQADHPAWGKTVSHLLRQGAIRNPKTGRDVGDHPPITPMKAAPRDEFSKGRPLSWVFANSQHSL